MIKSALLAFEQRVGLHMETKAKEMVTIEQARVSLNDNMERIREEFKLSEKRFTELIDTNNATFEEHKAALLKVVADLGEAGVSGPRIATALGCYRGLDHALAPSREPPPVAQAYPPPASQAYPPPVA